MTGLGYKPNELASLKDSNDHRQDPHQDHSHKEVFDPVGCQQRYLTTVNAPVPSKIMPGRPPIDVVIKPNKNAA